MIVISSRPATALACAFSPPPEPTKGFATGSQKFAWDANAPGDNVTNYVFYAGKTAGVYDLVIDVGNFTSYVFPRQGREAYKYFALKAENADGESPFSNVLILA